MNMPIPEVTDRRVNIVLGVGIATFLVLIAAVWVSLPATLDARDLAEESDKTNDLGSCRAQARVEVDLADLQVTITQADLNKTSRDASRAIAQGNGADLAAAVAAGDQAQAKADEEMADLIEAFTVYMEQLTLAREDPETFLNDCMGA